MAERLPKFVIVGLIVGYFVYAALVVFGMFAVRRNIVPELSTAQSQADWEAWRAEAAQQDGTHGPVQRVVPRSLEPPMLVLMRDYFPACLFGLLVPLSALYGVIAWMACGVARQSNVTPSPSGRGQG